MLHEINLSRIDLNLFVLFEAVREEAMSAAPPSAQPVRSAVSHGLSRLRRLLNDPLFLRTPKGVVPTVRAEELAVPIAEILAQARRVVATAEPFDPHRHRGASRSARPTARWPRSCRRCSTAFAHRHRRSTSASGKSCRCQACWDRPCMEHWLADLESRALDIAILPVDRAPPRFSLRPLFDEEFVIGMRKGHPFARQPTLDRYCDARHLVVSMTGDPFGFVDKALQEHGRSRRIAMTVPNFMLALALVAESDLLAALPQSLLSRNTKRFGLRASRRLCRYRFPDQRGGDQSRADGRRRCVAIRSAGVRLTSRMRR